MIYLYTVYGKSDTRHVQLFASTKKLPIKSKFPYAELDQPPPHPPPPLQKKAPKAINC